MKNKGNHEKSTIVFSSHSVRVWSFAISGGVCNTAYRRDTPLAIDSFWRDIDILGLADRD